MNLNKHSLNRPFITPKTEKRQNRVKHEPHCGKMGLRTYPNIEAPVTPLHVYTAWLKLTG